MSVYFEVRTAILTKKNTKKIGETHFRGHRRLRVAPKHGKNAVLYYDAGDFEHIVPQGGEIGDVSDESECSIRRKSNLYVGPRCAHDELEIKVTSWVLCKRCEEKRILNLLSCELSYFWILILWAERLILSS